MITDIINENEMKPKTTDLRIHIIILIILLISRPIILAILENPELSLPQEPQLPVVPKEPRLAVVPRVEEIICSMNKRGHEYARLTHYYNLPNTAQEIEINPSIKWQSVTIFVVGTLIFYIAVNYFS